MAKCIEYIDTLNADRTLKACVAGRTGQRGAKSRGVLALPSTPRVSVLKNHVNSFSRKTTKKGIFSQKKNM